MPRSDQCAKCGKGGLIPDVPILDFTHGGRKYPLRVEVQENPEAWLFKGVHYGELTATICGRCGFAEIYVKNSEDLLKAHRHRRRKGKEGK
jgi:hypothetical protein